MKKVSLLYTTVVDISISNGPGVNEREFIGALERAKNVSAEFVIPKPRHIEKLENVQKIKFFYSGKGIFRFVFAQISQPLLVCRVLRKNNIDGIVIRSSLLPLFLTWLLGQVKTPVFLKTQGNPSIEWLCSQPGFKGWISRRIRPLNVWLHKKLFRRASFIDCCTPQLVQTVQALLPENEQDKVVHIENATNPERFYPMDKAICRSRLGLEQFCPVIGYVGGTPAERGGEHIIRAVSVLRHEYPDIAGCIVGGGEHECQELRHLAEDLNVGDRCLIPGRIDYDQVPYWINAFDVGIALDSADRLLKIGSSNQKIRQYLACGLPVISGKGTSQFIEDYDLGLLVHPEDEQEFLNALVDLIELSYEQKIKINHNGIELCKKEFSIDAAVQQRLEYWQKAI